MFVVLGSVLRNQPTHPYLKGFGTPWVCARESRENPVLFDTKRDKMTAAIKILYLSFLSYSTKWA